MNVIRWPRIAETECKVWQCQHGTLHASYNKPTGHCVKRAWRRCDWVEKEVDRAWRTDNR